MSSPDTTNNAAFSLTTHASSRSNGFALLPSISQLDSTPASFLSGLPSDYTSLTRKISSEKGQETNNKIAKLHANDSPCSAAAEMSSNVKSELSLTLKAAMQEANVEQAKLEFAVAAQKRPLLEASGVASLPTFDFLSVPTDLLELILSYSTSFDILAACFGCAVRNEEEQFLHLCNTTQVWEAIASSPFYDLRELQHFAAPAIPQLQAKFADVVLDKYYELFQRAASSGDPCKLFEKSLQKESGRLINMLLQLHEIGKRKPTTPNEGVLEVSAQSASAAAGSTPVKRNRTGDLEIDLIFQERGNFLLTVPRVYMVILGLHMSKYFEANPLLLLTKDSEATLNAFLLSYRFAVRPEIDIPELNQAYSEIQTIIASSTQDHVAEIENCQSDPAVKRCTVQCFDIELASILICFQQRVCEKQLRYGQRFIESRINHLLKELFVLAFMDSKDRECRENILAYLCWYRSMHIPTDSEEYEEQELENQEDQEEEAEEEEEEELEDGEEKGYIRAEAARNLLKRYLPYRVRPDLSQQWLLSQAKELFSSSLLFNVELESIRWRLKFVLIHMKFSSDETSEATRLLMNFIRNTSMSDLDWACRSNQSEIDERLQPPSNCADFFPGYRFGTSYQQVAAKDRMFKFMESSIRSWMQHECEWEWDSDIERSLEALWMNLQRRLEPWSFDR